MAVALIVVDNSGRRQEIIADNALSLSQALFAAGLWPALPLCSGLGRCGLCRVRYLSDLSDLSGISGMSGPWKPPGPPEPTAVERDVLTTDELASGLRLACRHHPRQGDVVVLPPRPRAVPVEEREVLSVPAGPVRLAVDLGTTSVQWEAFTPQGVAARGRSLNPQLGAGSEVVSRLALAARGQGGLLQGVLLELLARVVGDIEELPAEVESMCVAANTAMTCLLLGLETSGLAAAPYRLDFRGGLWQSLAPDLPPCYIPPMIGPFAGGDLSAGLVAVLGSETGPPRPFLLADLGTNGEFALVLDDDRVLVTSVPLGPALEGIGLRHGSLAGPGVATRFEFGPQGLTWRMFGGPGQRPVAVSGTGYLSLLAALLRVGLLDRHGGFRPEASTPLAAKLAGELSVARSGESRFALAPGLWLHASDVEELLKVKAAFNTAMSALLAEAGLAAGKVRTVFLAGALGEHAVPADLERLGFLPPLLAGRAQAAGNTSLAGARALLRDKGARERLKALAARATVLDLAASPGFERDYLTRMVFDYVP